MKTLLLCGYRPVEENERGVAETIDRRIEQLKAFSSEVICVLAGPYADDLLRACPRISNVELVFDTHENANLTTNLRAGLAAIEGEACFVLPWEINPGRAETWGHLKTEFAKVGFATTHSILQAVDNQGAPFHYGFPLLVTRSGNDLLQELTDLRSLTDARLSYLQLDV